MRRELARRPQPVDAVAVGASAGGIDAILKLFEGLVPPWRAAVIVVLHLPEDRDSTVSDVFAQRFGAHVAEARPRAPVEAGRLYVAPAGYHLLVESDRCFALSCDAPVLFSRPAIDVLMSSCADAYGPRLAGVLLTGASEDGARGLADIRAQGGLVLVQDPDEAVQSAMPLAALARVQPDAVLPLAGLRNVLEELLQP
jgi:two-component system chemotaxis response regulator CheB